LSGLVILRDLAPAVSFGWLGRLLVFVLLVVVPFLSLFQRGEREMVLPPRRALYLSAVIGMVILVAITVVVLLAEGVPLSAVGLHSTSAAAFLAWTTISTIGALLGDFLITRVALRLGIRESRLTQHLMPRTRRESLGFLGVSASAGFGEELTYHGFLLAGLTAWLVNGWLAAAVANVAFGLLHGYQGQAGAVRAFVMGYLFCLPVITGAGLWPAIVGHFLVNALLGLGLWRLMIPPSERPSEV
jgi:hypothetical protein